MNTEAQQINQPAFKLKGSVLTLSVLQLLTIDHNNLLQQLEETTQKNPNFFKNMPIIIDLQKIYNFDFDVDFVEIYGMLRKHGFVPVGISNGNPRQINAATAAGFAVLSNIKTTQAPKNASKKVEKAKVVNQPIRSGQQIYAKNCDLVILASVSNGAEILADGNIHVYGSLRGRAIAGVTGDKNARIFCHKLEAELISIAGLYRLHDDIVIQESTNGIHIYLENDQLVIAPIN